MRPFPYLHYTLRLLRNMTRSPRVHWYTHALVLAKPAAQLLDEADAEVVAIRKDFERVRMKTVDMGG
jgi:hypothetical protein